MHDAATVRCGKGVSHLNRDRESTAQVEWSPVDYVAHVASFDVLHCDKLNVAGFMQPEDRADVWMIERGRKLGFAFEANEVGSTVREIRWEYFYDCGPIERRINDLVDSALSAFTDFFDDAIMEEELTEHRRMGIEPAFGAAYSGQDFGNLQAER
jgi:hypothetical protein